jgi:hypothetical protein
MRYLNPVLVPEGPSDAWFFPTLIGRALNQICLREATAPVEVADVQVLPVDRSGGLVDGVISAVTERLDSTTVVFYHYDGGSDAGSERAKYWDPLVAAWQLLPGERQLVPLVPVREMEAWALADRTALRRVAGDRWLVREVFQRDRLAEVERLTDPKRTLRDIASSGRGARLRARDPADYLTLLAEHISLAELAAVPSFQCLSADTVAALRELRYLS